MKLFIEAVVSILHWFIGELPQTNDEHRELKVTGGIGVLTSTVLFGMWAWPKYGWITLLYATIFLLVVRLIIVYRRFLWKAFLWLISLPAKYMAWVGGYDWATLNTLNKGQKIKAVAVGCLVHIPVLWGVGAIGFTLSDGLKLQQPAIGVGTVVYGLIILFLERGLIISLRRKRKYVPAHTIPEHKVDKLIWRKRKYESRTIPEKHVPAGEKWVMNYWGLIPRIALAIAIAYFDSLPLELRYFKAEINEELASQKVAEFERIDSVMKLQLTEKDVAIEKKRQKVADAQQALFDEMNGKPGLSQGTGFGPNAKIKKAILEEATREYNSEKATLQTEKDSIISKYTTQKSSFEENQADGIGAQYEALKSAGKKKPIIGFWEWVLRLVSILIQLVPAIIKIILPVDSYERTLAKMEEEEENEMSKSLQKSRADLEKAQLESEGDLYKASKEVEKAQIIADAEVESTRKAVEHLPKPKAPSIRAKVDDYLSICKEVQKMRAAADELDDTDPAKPVLNKLADDALTKLKSYNITS